MPRFYMYDNYKLCRVSNYGEILSTAYRIASVTYDMLFTVYCQVIAHWVPVMYVTYVREQIKTTNSQYHKIGIGVCITESIRI